MLIRRKSMISGIERARDIPVDVEDFARYQLGLQSFLKYDR